jgi:hypothetical protein
MKSMKTCASSAFFEAREMTQLPESWMPPSFGKV